MDDSALAPATAGRCRTATAAGSTSTVSLPQAASGRLRAIPRVLRAFDAQAIVHQRLPRVSGPFEQADPVLAGSDQAPRQRQGKRAEGIGRDPVPAPYAPATRAGDLHPVSTGTTGVRGMKDDGEETKIAG